MRTFTLPAKWILVAMIGLSNFATSAAEPKGQVSWDDLEWKWDDKQSHIAHYAKAYKGMFEVTATSQEEGESRAYHTLRVTEAGRVLYEEKLRPTTAFGIRGNRLYITDYYPIASGCELIAIDLPTGKQLWKTRLVGLGPIDHTKYSNRVALRIAGNAAVVYGNEAAGKYMEIVDLKTGRTLNNRRFE